MRRTRIEKEVEICATNLANKTKYLSANTKKWKKNVKTCSIYHLNFLWIFVNAIYIFYLGLFLYHHDKLHHHYF
jgi:hypothetical protein